MARFRFAGGASIESSQEDATASLADGPAALDTASTSCAFTFEATSVSGDIDIVANALSCSDDNKCIVCTPTAALGDCDLSCTGVIPSNAATAADAFNIHVTFTAAFTTDMPTPDGMLRLDTATTLWPEFDLTEAPVVDLDGCNGPVEMEVSTTDPTGGIDASSATSASKGYDIVAVGDGTCTLTATYTAAMPLTGAATPGFTIDLDRGSIDFTGKICDASGVPGDCPPP